MKKIFILSAALLINLTSFAQRAYTAHSEQLHVINPASSANPYARTTLAAGDTLVVQNTPDTAAHTLYGLGIDSGYVYGTNYWGDMAFAERYNVSDSSRNMQVIGVMALFGGRVNPASGKTVTFKVWDQGGQQLITGSQFYNGFPNNVLDSQVVPVTQLGIGTGTDTMKRFLFASGTGNLSTFFVGYSINYNFLALDGDTIGLASTLNGNRKPHALYTLSLNISAGDTVLDTTVNVQNATLSADHVWYDNYTQADSLFNNLAIYPIVIAGYPVSTKGVTRNNFTFFGSYPNPAPDHADIAFALADGADVTLQLMDMNGNVLNRIKQPRLSAGQHTIRINTANLSSGDYLYLIRTSAGDGIAGKMTVVH